MKVYKWSVLLLVLVLLFVACESQEETEAAPTEAVTDDAAATGTDAEGDASAKSEGDKFVVGFDANFPPYGYLDDDEYVGFDLDLAQEVATRRGWELVKQPIDWDAKDMELNSGTIDCIWNGFTINGREDLYLWTEPYVDNSQVFAVKEASGIKTFADLAGKNVLVQADSSALHALEGDDFADLVASFATFAQVPDYNGAFMNLESGAADAVALDIGVADYQIESREGKGFVKLEEPIVVEQYGVGFKLGNEALRDQVQETLNDMKADGTFQSLAEKWNLTDSVIE
jgi:polar amino acid transport system substrate-binding protein